MNVKAIRLYEITPEQLQELIEGVVKKQLDVFEKLLKPEPQKEYLSRNDVAKLFGVHVTTISAWQKNGTLNPKGICGKVFFLRSEIEASLKPLNV